MDIANQILYPDISTHELEELFRTESLLKKETIRFVSQLNQANEKKVQDDESYFASLIELFVEELIEFKLWKDALQKIIEYESEKISAEYQKQVETQQQQNISLLQKEEQQLQRLKEKLQHLNQLVSQLTELSSQYENAEAEWKETFWQPAMTQLANNVQQNISNPLDQFGWRDLLSTSEATTADTIFAKGMSEIHSRIAATHSNHEVRKQVHEVDNLIRQRAKEKVAKGVVPHQAAQEAEKETMDNKSKLNTSVISVVGIINIFKELNTQIFKKINTSVQELSGHELINLAQISCKKVLGKISDWQNELSDLQEKFKNELGNQKDALKQKMDDLTQKIKQEFMNFKETAQNLRTPAVQAKIEDLPKQLSPSPAYKPTKK